MVALSPSKPYRIGRSRTGLGLFATRPIKKGTKIIRYFGPLLDSKKKKDDAVDNKYLFEISNRWTIDGSPRNNVARYINHACKPNAESDVKVRKRPSVDLKHFVIRNGIRFRIELREISKRISQGVSKLSICVDHARKDFVGTSDILGVIDRSGP